MGFCWVVWHLLEAFFGDSVKGSAERYRLLLQKDVRGWSPCGKHLLRPVISPDVSNMLLLACCSIPLLRSKTSANAWPKRACSIIVLY
ncbi:hypothetical protein V5799_032111 [Amblyomma americanum]|uniref:Secreted protein n=1 Tax=Amblyomma americanum TaxID=6943 RepID=A0AAQ4DS35_AMBAM